MLQTSGKESGIFDAESAVGFNWTKKSFEAALDMPLKDLTENVKFVSVNFTDDSVAKEIDTLIEVVVKNDKEIDRLEKESDKSKTRLDEIVTQRVKATRKTNTLMDFLREKWSVAMLPFTTVVFGRKYKASKSRGSVGTSKPDYEKIVSALVARHPKMVKEVEDLKKTIVTVPKSTSSRWSNFSEIDSEK